MGRGTKEGLGPSIKVRLSCMSETGCGVTMQRWPRGSSAGGLRCLSRMHVRGAVYGGGVLERDTGAGAGRWSTRWLYLGERVP
jgi:hypothetical protein